MRNLILFLLLIPGALFAQRKHHALDELSIPIDSVTGTIRYRGVVEVPHRKAADLFARARTYVLKRFKSTGVLPLVEDQEAGLFSVKGICPIVSKANGRALDYYVTVDIRVKDGRYAYELSQLALVMPPGARMTDYSMDKVLQELKKHPFGSKAYRDLDIWDAGIKAYLTGLETFVKSKTEGDNW